MARLIIEEGAGNEMTPSPLNDHPLFRLGFRPFYLLAAAFAMVSIPVWLVKYFGWTSSFANVDLTWQVHVLAHSAAASCAGAIAGC